MYREKMTCVVVPAYNKEKLLANPVIEQYGIEVVEGEERGPDA
jgi:hypothetical protein